MGLRSEEEYRMLKAKHTCSLRNLSCAFCIGVLLSAGAFQCNMSAIGFGLSIITVFILCAAFLVYLDPPSRFH
jgi:hypothetical protein